MNANACRESITQFELSKLTLRNLNKFKLSPTGKLVLMALVDCYPKIFPSMQYIADEIGISLSSVKRAIAELRKIGLVMVELKNSNNYTLTNIFFEQLELTQMKAQNESPNRVNLTPKETIKQNNKQSSVFKFQKEFVSCPTVETTKQYLSEQKKIKAECPLDFSEEKAIKWFYDSPEYIQRGFFGKKIKAKYNLV